MPLCASLMACLCSSSDKTCARAPSKADKASEMSGSEPDRHTFSKLCGACAGTKRGAARAPERWLKSCIREAGSRLLSVLNATAHQKHMRRCCSRDFDEKQSGGRIGAGATTASRTPSEHLLNSLHCFRFDFSVRVHLLQHLARMMQGRHRLRG